MYTVGSEQHSQGAYPGLTLLMQVPRYRALLLL